MNKIIKSLFSHPFIFFFNISIFFGLVSDEFIEKILGPIIEDFCITPIREMANKFKDNSSDENLTEEILVARKLSIELTDSVCGVIIWNKEICTRISQKILKEKFRKLSWELRCAGLDFSIEV